MERQFNVTLCLDVGDPETVGRMDIPNVTAADPAAAAAAYISRLSGSGGGFTPADVIQIVVTRAEPGVAANLIPAHPRTHRP